MIKIDKSINIHKINLLFSELVNDNDKKKDLYLPKNIDKLDFGVFFSFLQFLATWVRHTNSGKLILPVNGIDEAISYLNDNEFVYPSIVLCWEKEILDLSGFNLRNALKDPSKKYFEKMDFYELKGNSVPIFCFDHDKSKRGLSKNLYKTDNEVVSEDGLGFNLYPAFQKIGSFNKFVFRNSIKKNFDSFIAIIHELFYNTHEHATTNEHGYNLYPNIRGIQLKFHKKTIQKFIEEYSELPGLLEYFKSEFKLNEQGELYLIEISILDSGPGLVKRYKNVSNFNFSIKEEVDTIKQCLYRRNTSATISKRDTKGIGLDRVLQTIDGKGFVRIKSGRVDVFRNMKSLRYEHHEHSSDIKLYDWNNNSYENFTINAPTEGTLVSIFYPLEFEKA